ncbi:MAG: amidase [Chloroflexi bacterium]|nr:amidase [Chloroflexota bacterium]
MSDSELLYQDITSLGKLYRSGALSPVEVTRAVLDRIEQVDGRLNAFITVLREQALRDAQDAEIALRSGLDLGPLHGIPFSLKDIFDTAGIRTTAGSRHWVNRIPEQTATSAQRLMDSGAILIGKCNLLEFAYGIVHPDYGQCNNPWDVSRTAGGSSSGSAASISAGIGWGSLGTDTGGSIRIPASYCGVVGLKPTYGRVSKHGVFPLSWSLDHVGIMARSVKDAAILLQVVAGYDPQDPTSSRSPVPDYCVGLNMELKGVKIGVLEHHINHPDLRPLVGEVSWKAVKTLEELGGELVPVSIPDIDLADQAMLISILPEATLAHEHMLKEEPENYAEMTRQQLELGTMLSAVDYLRAQQYRNKLLAAFLEVFQKVDVIVNPTVAFEAPAEDPVVAAGQGSDEARRTGIYNLTGLPAVTVPCGFGQDHLPLGLQIAGAPMAEATILQVASAYERAAFWYEKHPIM